MGSYILVLQLDMPVPGLQVGRLGRFDFAAGTYFYLGSAFGPGGPAARLAHHQRRVKRRPHWHIDYLRAHARLCEAWTVSGGPRLECIWCRTFAACHAFSIPAPGFGSRDTGCPSHLFYAPEYPGVRVITEAMLQRMPLTPEVELLIEVRLFEE